MGRFGIKARLMLAFSVVASLTVVASAVAWISYTNIAASFSAVTVQSVPAMSSALNLAAESAALSAAAPALAAADSDQARAAHMASLQARIETLEGAIESLAQTTLDNAAVDGIKALEVQMVANLRTLDGVVAERLQRKTNREAAAAEIARLHAEILAQLVPLVDDANFELVIVSETTTTEVSETLQRLLNEGVNNLRRILEVNAQTNLAVGILTEATSVTSSELLTPVKERFTAAAQALEESLAELPEGESFKQLRDLATLLLDFGKSDNSVFEMRRRQLAGANLSEQMQATAAELLRLHQEFLIVAVPMIDDINFDLVIEGEGAVERNAELIQGLVNDGVGRVRGMVEALAEVNLIAGLLSQGANALESAFIQPLKERYTASAERLAASLAAIPDDDSTAELKPAAQTLAAYGEGDNSIFAQRTDELAVLAKGQSILAENLTMAGKLSELVAGMVSTSDNEMSDATAGVTSAIVQGKTWLLIITGASLLTALAIAVLYVGRNLVGRLTGLARVMDELANGNLKVEIPSGGSDEITGMANTLFVFRSGLLEVEAARERTEEERRKAAEQRR
ncbi:MAG: HAMP domain-containing protein, partial [Kiloniellales bacterium]